MRSVLGILLLLVIFSCRKEVFDPNRYDNLIYKPAVFKPSTTLEALIDGKTWTASSVKAQADSTVLEISGNSSTGDRLYFKLKDFKTLTKFLPNQGLDSVYLKSGSKSYIKMSDEALSEITLISLDTITKIIEGSFVFSMKDSEGKTLTVEQGYFKLLYREEFMRLSINDVPWIADTVWAKVDTLKKPNVITIVGENFQSKNTITIVMSIEQAALAPTSFKQQPQLPYISLTSGKEITYNRTGGSIRLSINNPDTKSIVATFNAQLTTFDAISNGKFSISYQR